MVDISDPNWSEVDGNNTGAPPLGWPANMQPNQVEPTARAMMGGTKRFWNRSNATVTTTGASGTYVYTPVNAGLPLSYVQGELYTFEAHQVGIGSDTFQVLSLGAKPLYKPGAIGPRVLEAGDIQANSIYSAYYDGALGGTGAFQVIAGCLPTGVRGVVLGLNAAAGIVGEYISSVVLVGAEVNITTPGANVTSISLLPGDYDMSGELWVDTLTGSAASNGLVNAAITTVSATLPTVPADGSAVSHINSGAPVVSATSAFILPVGPTRLNTSVTTTVYLFGRGSVTSGTLFGYGILRARRVR